MSSLSYDDVLLIPRLSYVNSRKDISLNSSVTKDIPVKFPIISANMPSVTGTQLAVIMGNLGGFSILPRFNEIGEAVRQFKIVHSYGVRVGVSLGIGDDTWDRFVDLWDAGARIFCIDVAHGHHIRVIEYINQIKQEFGEDLEIIAGNVATYSGAYDLAEIGADAIKVGIGPGAACTTREVTGFGVPQLTAIVQCADIKETFPDVKIIADGGIKNSGDIVKALAFGADTVMLGKLLAGAKESPHPGEYFGNASARLRDYRSPEGVEGTVEIEGPLEDIVKKINWGIKSGLSYAGVSTIHELHNDPPEHHVVSSQTMNETRTRI